MSAEQLAAKVKVRLFHELRTSIGESEVEFQADTLNQVIEGLIHRNGAVKDILYDPEGHLRGYVLFYINNVVQNPPEMSRKLNDGDLVLLVPAAAGG
jgi:molybdopterin converting factor small subunit